MATGYIPDRGEIVWLVFNPRKEHEQAGRRPALVMSPKSYNGKAGLALFCPITSRVKGYPFEVRLPDDLEVDGAVLCDQLKSLDWKSRRARRICPAPADVLDEATAKILALIDPG